MGGAFVLCSDNKNENKNGLVLCSEKYILLVL